MFDNLDRRKAVFRLEITTNKRMTTEEWRRYVSQKVFEAEMKLNETGEIRAHIHEWEYQ